VHRRRVSGFTLLELLVVAAVIGVVALSLPRVSAWSAGLRVGLAADEVVGVLRLARTTALHRGENVGVKFRRAADGRVSFTLHRDGDGDGVLSADIESGVDPRLAAPRTLRHFGTQARVGFPAGSRPRDPGDPRRRLDRLSDPIRFNRSDLASFGPLGTSTPGSIYITDGRHHLVVVRVFGRTGKVRTLSYDSVAERWR
jgi:prepilin-type N-terminal cleavage/methylation domain-containing protein